MCKLIVEQCHLWKNYILVTFVSLCELAITSDHEPHGYLFINYFIVDTPGMR